MMFTFLEFLQWEEASRDTIDFKLIYADIAQDLLSGLVLSELVYWHLPSRSGTSRMRVIQEGYEWVVAQRKEWWQRTRMTPRQIDQVVNKLVQRNLVIKCVRKFGRNNALHLRINQEVFMAEWQRVLQSPPLTAYEASKAKVRLRKSPNGDSLDESPNGDSSAQVNHQMGSSIYTETTLTESTDSAPKGAKTPKPKPERKPRQPDPEFDPVFDAVAEQIFAHDPKQEGYRNSRVAAIAQWLTGRYNGRDANRITKLSHPAKAEHVAYFVQWWQQSKLDVDLPQNLIAFATHWQTWGSERRKEIEQGRTPPGWKPMPVQEQSAPSEDDLSKRRNFIESRKRGA